MVLCPFRVVCLRPPPLNSSVLHNTSGATVSFGSVQLPPDLLDLHPGPSGQNSVVRWTAPAAGDYHIVGRFEGIDTRPTTTDVSILKNSTELKFLGSINGFGASSAQPFDLLVTMAAGDRLDFSVGIGGNNYFFDSTGLAVTITSTSATPTPTPTATPTPTPTPEPTPTPTPSPSPSPSPSPTPMPTPTPTPNPTGRYEAVADFSLTQNPSGVWSYGFTAADSNLFNRYDFSDGTLSGGGQWHRQCCEYPKIHGPEQSFGEHAQVALLASEHGRERASQRAALHRSGDGQPRVTVTVTRTGDTSGAASVQYLTTSAAAPEFGALAGTANERSDYQQVIGSLYFACAGRGRFTELDCSSLY